MTDVLQGRGLTEKTILARPALLDMQQQQFKHVLC